MEALTRPFEDILIAKPHRIPSYQRRYAWTRGNLEDYWHDITERPAGHFMGSMVVCGELDEPREVIDGQQRLTTTVIALAAIRDSLDELGEVNLSEGIQDNFIFFKDKSGKRRPRISADDTNVSQRLENEILTRAGQRKPSSALNDPKVKELQAYAVLKELVQGSLIGKEHKAQVRELEALRDRVLGAQVVYVTVRDRSAGFKIFETLNDRGKSLAVIDLIKNYLFQHLSSESSEQMHRAWGEINDMVEEYSIPSLPGDQFIYYAWNSRAVEGKQSPKFVTNERIFRALSDEIDGAETASRAKCAQEMINDFHFAAKVLRLLHGISQTGGASSPWKEIDRNYRGDKYARVNRSIIGILSTQAQQPSSLIISLMRAYLVDRTMSFKQLSEFLGAIERFQYRWTIAGKGSTEAQRKPYRAAATAVAAASDGNAIHTALREFMTATQRILPTDIMFKDGIKRLKYSHGDRKNKWQIIYLLQEINRKTDGPKDLPTDPTLEHIANTANLSEKTPRNSWVFKVGNLLILPAEVNSALGREFSQKKDTLRSYVAEGDACLLDAIKAGTWGNMEANRRTDWICDEAVKIWT